MKHDNNDDLHFLKAAWNSLEAPDLTRELVEEDEPTRAAVTWLQAAYQSAAPDVKPLPKLSRPTAAQRASALAVAAAILAAFIHLVTLIPSIPKVEVAVAPAPVPTPAPTPKFNPLTGQLELQSGPVRLIFIND